MGQFSMEISGCAGSALSGNQQHDLRWNNALTYVADLACRPSGQARVAFLNANNANIMLDDEEYRDILADHIVFPDGVGIDLASYVLNGSKFEANLNGTDFVPAMLTFIETPRRVALIGGTPAVLAGAAEHFRQHTPWHEFIPIADGYFDKNDSAEVVRRLAEAKVDILLVGMGTPLQEKWVHDNIDREHARLVLSVGALFDFVSELVPRAPAWMRKLRLEWIYRIACEPDRLWRRYILGGPVFLLRLLQNRVGVMRRISGRYGARQAYAAYRRSDDIPGDMSVPLKSVDRRRS